MYLGAYKDPIINYQQKKQGEKQKAGLRQLHIQQHSSIFFS
jgi:hypothetical protein